MGTKINDNFLLYTIIFIIILVILSGIVSVYNKSKLCSQKHTLELIDQRLKDQLSKNILAYLDAREDLLNSMVISTASKECQKNGVNQIEISACISKQYNRHFKQERAYLSQAIQFYLNKNITSNQSITSNESILNYLAIFTDDEKFKPSASVENFLDKVDEGVLSSLYEDEKIIEYKNGKFSVKAPMKDKTFYVAVQNLYELIEFKYKNINSYSSYWDLFWSTKIECSTDITFRESQLMTKIGYRVMRALKHEGRGYQSSYVVDGINIYKEDGSILNVSENLVNDLLK